jgi:hypothetical protein
MLSRVDVPWNEDVPEEKTVPEAPLLALLEDFDEPQEGLS